MLIIKLGGASVVAPENFLKIADLIIEKFSLDKEIVVVISAMGRTTDQLMQLAQSVNPTPPARELDMLISVGERVSIALLAMALAAKGHEAVSFTGSQSGIITDECHSDAKIVDVRPHRLESVLEKGKIAIVAGFQGVSRCGEITTLGRDGSDTSAVALAVALRSPHVLFYKDVSGVFSMDPKQDEQARWIPKLSYTEALEIAAKGAKVLHPRSIALAKKNGIRLWIRSFHHPSQEGTLIGEGAELTNHLRYELGS